MVRVDVATKRSVVLRIRLEREDPAGWTDSMRERPGRRAAIGAEIEYDVARLQSRSFDVNVGGVLRLSTRREIEGHIDWNQGVDAGLRVIDDPEPVLTSGDYRPVVIVEALDHAKAIDEMVLG